MPLKEYYCDLRLYFGAYTEEQAVQIRDRIASEIRAAVSHRTSKVIEVNEESDRLKPANYEFEDMLTLDFFGKRYGIGSHDICLAEMTKGETNVDKSMDLAMTYLRGAGWDVQRLPYDHETNPEGIKVRLTIHSKEGIASKQP